MLVHVLVFVLLLQPQIDSTAATRNAEIQVSEPTPSLDRLSLTQRNLVENFAKSCRRFGDGSIWSHAVDDEFKKLPANRPIREAYLLNTAPRWSRLGSTDTAQSEEEVHRTIETKDVRSQLGDAIYFDQASVLHATDFGIVVDTGLSAILLDATGTLKSARPGATLPPFAAVHDGKQEDYLVPGLPRRDKGGGKAPAGSPRELDSMILQNGSGPKYGLEPATWVRLPKWQEIQLPRSRIHRKSEPVSGELIASLVLNGQIDGIPLFKAKRTSRNGLIYWTWDEQTLKLRFSD